MSKKNNEKGFAIIDWLQNLNIDKLVEKLMLLSINLSQSMIAKPFTFSFKQKLQDFCHRVIQLTKMK